MQRYAIIGLAATLVLGGLSASAEKPDGEGWKPLFAGDSLEHWKVPKENEIWTVKDGVIDCQPRIDVPGEKQLWSKESFGDFELYVEWRIKETKGTHEIPVVMPDGTHKKTADGEYVTQVIENADSGIYLRGDSKSQVNIWRWPVGSGEVYGYRTDSTMPDEVRAGVTPSKNMDKPVGEWNAFHITMDGDRLTVKLNGETVIENAKLPGVNAEGPIALQHHGGYDSRRNYWSPASSLVQFRDIYVRPIEHSGQSNEN